MINDLGRPVLLKGLAVAMTLDRCFEKYNFTTLKLFGTLRNLPETCTAVEPVVQTRPNT